MIFKQINMINYFMTTNKFSELIFSVFLLFSVENVTVHNTKNNKIPFLFLYNIVIILPLINFTNYHFLVKNIMNRGLPTSLNTLTTYRSILKSVYLTLDKTLFHKFPFS